MCLKLSFDHLVLVDEACLKTAISAFVYALILLLTMFLLMLGFVMLRSFPNGNEPDHFKAGLSKYARTGMLEVL